MNKGYIPPPMSAVMVYKRKDAAQIWNYTGL